MFAAREHRGAPLAGDGDWGLFLAEFNHRVGNELQVALSALRLAKRKLESAEAMHFIDEATARLECFGQVHQLLDRQRRQGPLAQRLEALCRAISLSMAAPLEVRLTLTLDDVAADEETAWTLCVVAFELMTNAFKHAFPASLPGAVDVVLRQDGEGVVLAVRDNGIGTGVGGRSAERLWQMPDLGSGIVAQLAERLGGFATRVRGPGGTTATFRVPAARSMQ
jgi:two-component sensor histidine kinase